MCLYGVYLRWSSILSTSNPPPTHPPTHCKILDPPLHGVLVLLFPFKCWYHHAYTYGSASLISRDGGGGGGRGQRSPMFVEHELTNCAIVWWSVIWVKQVCRRRQAQAVGARRETGAGNYTIPREISPMFTSLPRQNYVVSAAITPLPCDGARGEGGGPLPNVSASYINMKGSVCVRVWCVVCVWVCCQLGSYPSGQAIEVSVLTSVLRISYRLNIIIIWYPDRQTDTDRQTDRQTGIKADRQTYRQRFVVSLCTCHKAFSPRFC